MNNCIFSNFCELTQEEIHVWNGEIGSENKWKHEKTLNLTMPFQLKVYFHICAAE